MVETLRPQLLKVREMVRAANLVIEVRDARIPRLTEGSTLLGRSLSNRRSWLVLNKADLANPNQTRAWREALKPSYERIFVVTARQLGSGEAPQLRKGLEQEAERVRGRGLLRAVVVGMPNVGKSTVLNMLLRRSKARTGDRPGVTRGKQWLRFAPTGYLLDTPGVLPLVERLERQNPDDVYKMVLCRVAPEGSLEVVDVAAGLLGFLEEQPEGGKAGQALGSLKGRSVLECLQELALRRNLLGQGGRPDVESAARALLKDYHRGRLGRLTLEPFQAG